MVNKGNFQFKQSWSVEQDNLSPMGKKPGRPLFSGCERNILSGNYILTADGPHFKIFLAIKSLLRRLALMMHFNENRYSERGDLELFVAVSCGFPQLKTALNVGGCLRPLDKKARISAVN